MDKFSAYDMVLAESILPAALDAAGGPAAANQSLVYISNRLKNRQTFLEFNNIIMGPIKDQRGVKQGALGSSDEF